MRPNAARSERPRFARLVRVAAAIVVSLAAFYILAANVFLSTSLFRRIVDAHPDSIQIHFERAWSLFPGHLHAKKLSIRGRDSHVEWRIVLDDVDFRVALGELLEMHFEASHVRAKGLSFRLRKRLEGPPTSPDQVAHLPPIEGFPPYSVRPPKKPGPPGRLWTIELQDVVARDVREVWVEQGRFQGSARVDGRFYLKPLRAIEVGPAHAAIARGDVSTSRGQVAHTLDGSVVEVTVSRFDPQAAAGADILRSLSLACDAQLTLPDVARLPLALPADSTIHGAVEVRRAAVHLTSGVLNRDSHLMATAREVVFASAEHRVRGALLLAADVAAVPGNKGDQLTFRADMTEVEASHTLQAKGPMRPVLQASKATAKGDSRELSLAHFLADLHLAVEVPDGTANARELSRYIPPKAEVALVNGHASAALSFETWAAERRATGHGVLRADDLHFRLAKMHVRGRVSMQAQFASYEFDTHHLHDATLAIEALNGALSSDAAPDTPLVRLNTAQLRVQAPTVDLDDPLRALRVSIAIPSARIASRGLLRAYLPHGSEMQIATSHSTFSLKSALEIEEHLARGTLDLESRGLTIDYRDFRLHAHVGARGRVHAWRWETGHLALDEAEVGVTDLAVASSRAGRMAAPAMSIARAELRAKSAHFEFDDPLAELTLSAALVDAKVRDSSAINAFLPKEANFALEGDHAGFGAQLDLDIVRHTAAGTVRAKASKIGATKGPVHLHGDVDLFAKFSDWSFEHHTMALLDSRVEVTGVAGRFTAEGPPQLSAARLTLATSAPEFDLARPTVKGADFHFVFDDGELPDARALAPLLPEDGVLGIESGSAHVAADIAVSHTRRTATGRVEVDVEQAGFRLHTTRLSGNFRFVVRLSGFDAEREAFDISGTRLEMRDVSVAGTTAATSHWRGDIAFSRASLGFYPTLLDGDLHVTARDARPLLALIFANDLPKIIVGLTDMPRLDGSLRLIAGPRQLALVDIQAGGGNFWLRGSHAVHGGNRRGGIVAKKAFVSIGLKLDDRGSHLRLFGLDGWLHDQSCAVSDLLATPIASCRR